MILGLGVERRQEEVDASVHPALQEGEEGGVQATVPTAVTVGAGAVVAEAVGMEAEGKSIQSMPAAMLSAGLTSVFRNCITMYYQARQARAKDF